MSKPNYDTTLARIAGNIAAGLVSHYGDHSNDDNLIDAAMAKALLIVKRCRIEGDADVTDSKARL